MLSLAKKKAERKYECSLDTLGEGLFQFWHQNTLLGEAREAQALGASLEGAPE